MSIKLIDKTSVHKICSGQVVLNLAIAVKELVENSLDAGSTNIEICLKESGVELVRVIDNGSGIEESNFDEIGTKHSTSKIEDFSDLTSVETFGFRGEALSSLCSLSNASITTRHKNTDLGHHLEFSLKGTLLKKSPVARAIGTTVSLENLFHTLPVRHKEFQRNLKKELTKMIHLLTSYCLIHPDVKFTCANHNKAGKKTVLLITPGAGNVKDNIATIFGSKQLNAVVEFKMVYPSSDILEEFSISQKSEESNSPFKVEGFISTCEHGQGRSSTDRQFLFINNRPCDLPKVVKIINEVYHSFNSHQYPFFTLNITLNRDAVDVNVTPDKRTIFIDHEKLLIATIKASLLKLYEHVPSTMNQSIMSFFQSPKLNDIDSPKDEGLDLTSLKRKASPQREESQETKCFKTNEVEVLENESFLSTCGQESSQNTKTETNTKVSDESFSNSQLLNATPKSQMEKLLSLRHSKQSTGNCVLEQKSKSITNYFSSQTKSDSKDSSMKLGPINFDLEEESLVSTEIDMEIKVLKQDQKNVKDDTLVLEDKVSVLEDKNTVLEDKDTALEDKVSVARNELPVVENIVEVIATDPMHRKMCLVEFSMVDLRSTCISKNLIDKGRYLRRFRAKINQSDNVNAEEELKRELSKEQFQNMEIIGQFNLGFIIAKLGTDLFIIDQHASDEKYNYEMLQKSTVLEIQKLFSPQKLELTVVNELILLDNLDVFNKNGFHFAIDHQADAGHKVSLVSIPLSQNWTFGKSDIEELIFMLTDSITTTTCRPSKLNSMFASRACRKSVMIGTSLSISDMKKLVFHMGEIEQPWNCPHGRPTIRHLVNLQLLS